MHRLHSDDEGSVAGTGGVPRADCQWEVTSLRNAVGSVFYLRTKSVNTFAFAIVREKQQLMERNPGPTIAKLLLLCVGLVFLAVLGLWKLAELTLWLWYAKGR